ncbi:MAG: YqgE/AlgH family protein [Gammaproteobacteria bacterium]|jgi:putative transcriptional regulator
MRRIEAWLAAGFGLLVLLGCGNRLEAALAPGVVPEIPRETGLEPAPGRFLVARRGFLDPFFNHSVIWLLQHDAKASFGLIVNQPLERQSAAVIPDFADTTLATLPVSHGGPVDPDMLVILLRRPAAPVLTARHVIADVYASLNRQLLIDLPAGSASADTLRLFLGHVGWTPGQLAAEIERRYWHVVEADPGVVFGAGAGDLWDTLIRRLEPPSADNPDLPSW